MEYNTDAYNYDSCTFNEEEFKERLKRKAESQLAFTAADLKRTEVNDKAREPEDLNSIAKALKENGTVYIRCEADIPYLGITVLIDRKIPDALRKPFYEAVMKRLEEIKQDA